MPYFHSRARTIDPILQSPTLNKPRTTLETPHSNIEMLEIMERQGQSV